VSATELFPLLSRLRLRFGFGLACLVVLLLVQPVEIEEEVSYERRLVCSVCLYHTPRRRP
jgi:hypothetical protein